jgi:hypothetical protein
MTSFIPAKRWFICYKTYSFVCRRFVCHLLISHSKEYKVLILSSRIKMTTLLRTVPLYKTVMKAVSRSLNQNSHFCCFSPVLSALWPRCFTNTETAVVSNTTHIVLIPYTNKTHSTHPTTVTTGGRCQMYVQPPTKKGISNMTVHQFDTAYRRSTSIKWTTTTHGMKATKHHMSTCTKKQQRQGRNDSQYYNLNSTVDLSGQSEEQLYTIQYPTNYKHKQCGKSSPATCHGGACGERRYSSYSFSTSALDGGEWSASRPGRVLPPGKWPPVPIVQEAGWAPEPVWTQEDRGKIL